MRLSHFLLLGILLVVLLCDVEAGCKGSKCRGAKRRKNEEERRADNDPLGQVEDIEGKKKEKAKSEEESEEKEEEKKAAVVVAASRRRRAEKELQRDRELGESQGTAHGKHRGSHNSHNHNHAHRRRHVTGHEHTHSKEEGEQARTSKDTVNGKNQRLRRAEKLAKVNDFAFGAHNKHSKRFWNKEKAVQSEEGDSLLPLRSSSFGRRHVTGEEHTHSGEQDNERKEKRSRSKKSLRHHHPNGDPSEHVPNPLEDHRVNMERRRYPIEIYSPFGKERVLPLPIPNNDYWDIDESVKKN